MAKKRALVPSKRQWRQWTLPSRLTFVGVLLARRSIRLSIIGIVLTIVFSIWQTIDVQEITDTLSGQDESLSEIGDDLSEIKELLKPIENTDYRELVADVIHAGFGPKADIKVGSGIAGPDGVRNVDIEVRSVVNGKHKLMVIKVVDLPGDEKVGVEVIDAFDSKRTDIQADVALVCSNTGFDSTAIRKAKRKGIGLISVLRQGDRRVKAIIEKEIYLRKINLWPIEMEIEHQPPLPSFRVKDVRYQGKLVDAWLLQKAMLVASLNPELSQEVTLAFNLKTPTEFEIKGRPVLVNSLSITFHPKTQWFAQTVQLDATNGIYDYLRGRVRLADGASSYIIGGYDFDLATPLSTPPSLNDLYFGLFPGELDVFSTQFETLSVPDPIEIPKLDDIVRPEDLEYVFDIAI